jgi:hypothetical protein
MGGRTARRVREVQRMRSGSVLRRHPLHGGVDMNTTTTETLAELKATQSVAPAWLLEMIEEHGADALVKVTRMATPWGTYLAGVTLTEGQ